MKDEQQIPAGFTLPMAVVDCLPVAFFAVSAISIAARFDSALFLVGALCAVAAGAMKAAWKFVLAIKKRDVPLLNRQFRVLMPAGFAVMAAALVVDRAKWSPAWVFSHLTAMPALGFLAVGVAGMFCMASFALHNDSRDAKANWREQIVNAVAQACVMMAVVSVSL